MSKRKGMFISIEGIDGCGSTTQIKHLHSYLKDLAHDNDVLTTCEPWRNSEIRERLDTERDAYSNGVKMAELYIDDRKKHQELIFSNLEKGVIVITDRHAMSTYAYQNIQGVSYDVIKIMHDKASIISPDITFFIDINPKIARSRILKRNNGKLDKFENNSEFVRKVIRRYKELAKKYGCLEESFGKIITINGNYSREKVTNQITKKLNPFYNNWRNQI